MDKIKEYFLSPRINNSFLGTMSNPRYVWLKEQGLIKDDFDKTHFNIGSAVDCLLTNPIAWGKEFYVSNLDNVSDMMSKFIKNLPPNIKKDSPQEMYQEAYDASGYSIKIDRVISAFWKNDAYNDYYISYVMNKNKTILTQNEYSVIINCVQLIEENEYVKPYFSSKEEHIEILKQLPLYFTYKELECKALLDGVLINHKEKTIQPYDLKTTGQGGGTSRFKESFVKFGYYRQAAFYTVAVKDYFNNTLSIVQDYSDYTWLPFKFIVVSSKPGSTYPAVIYTTTDNDIKVGLEGGTLKDGKEVKGINQLIDLYKWHKKTNQWNLTRELYENKGELVLDVFNQN